MGRAIPKDKDTLPCDITPELYEHICLKFWSKVNRQAPNGCWEWTGIRNSYTDLKYAYGHFEFRNQGWIASRFAWLLIYDKIPKNKLVLHKCDNPPCVNPAHLFLGTNKDNSQDAKRKGRLGRNRRTGITPVP